MRESKVESTVNRYAKSLGWWCIKFIPLGRKGLPDRIFIRKGILFFVEYKAPGEPLRKLQAYIRKKIEDNGFKVYRIDAIEKGKEIFNEYEK